MGIHAQETSVVKKWNWGLSHSNAYSYRLAQNQEPFEAKGVYYTSLGGIYSGGLAFFSEYKSKKKWSIVLGIDMDFFGKQNQLSYMGRTPYTTFDAGSFLYIQVGWKNYVKTYDTKTKFAGLGFPIRGSFTILSNEKFRLFSVLGADIRFLLGMTKRSFLYEEYSYSFLNNGQQTKNPEFFISTKKEEITIPFFNPSVFLSVGSDLKFKRFTDLRIEFFVKALVREINSEPNVTELNLHQTPQIIDRYFNTGLSLGFYL